MTPDENIPRKQWEPSLDHSDQTPSSNQVFELEQRTEIKQVNICQWSPVKIRTFHLLFTEVSWPKSK